MSQHSLGGRSVSLFFLTLSVFAIFLFAGQVDYVQNLLTIATGQEANLIIDTQADIDGLTPHWRNLAQGGESASYRFAPVQTKLSALEPEYIRLDHIYDFYDIVSRAQNGQLQYNWQQLDTVIGDITAVGATPFISLSYMPPALSQAGDITGAPDNYQEWQAVVAATIAHVSGPTGLNLSNVYYEVWNEPDLFGNWKTYGSKNYLDLYRHAALGSQSVADQTQPFKIGGPATTALYKNWVTNLIDHAKKHNLPLDFYSWHRYHHDLEKYQEDLELFDQWMQEHPDRLLITEALITEWGHTSAVDPGYDTNLAAAHQVAVASIFVDSYLDRAFTFEVQDGLDPAGEEYWGRWGLLTHQSFGSNEKPRYQAIQYLNRLGSQRLSVTGQGTWVRGIAAQDPATNAIDLIITNYDPNERHVETTPTTFTNLEPGQYQLTQELMGRNPTTDIFNLSGTSFQHQVTLPPNTVMHLRLTPLTQPN